MDLATFGGLAAQHAAALAQVRLQLIKHRFDLPALVVEHRQLQCRGRDWIEQRGQQTVTRRRVRQARQGVLNDAHRYSLGRPGTSPLLGRIDRTQVRAIVKCLANRQLPVGHAAPQQLRACCLGLAPVLVAIDAAIGQT